METSKHFIVFFYLGAWFAPFNPHFVVKVVVV